MWGRGPRDTDHDGVSNRKDKCPKEPGPWENQGCPANKKVEKKGNFQQYDDERINFLRDKLSHQMIWKQND